MASVLRCDEHDVGWLDVRVLDQCPECTSKMREWYRVADETARQINRWRRG